MGNQILNASDIEIKIGINKIAHITDGQLQMSHEARVILSNDTAPGEIKGKGKITWQITGTSLVEMSTGYSFKDLILLMLSREDVDLEFKALGLTLTGSAKLQNLTGGGATEQNATCSFTFDGQGTPAVNDDDDDDEADDTE